MHDYFTSISVIIVLIGYAGQDLYCSHPDVLHTLLDPPTPYCSAVGEGVHFIIGSYSSQQINPKQLRSQIASADKATFLTKYICMNARNKLVVVWPTVHWLFIALHALRTQAINMPMHSSPYNVYYVYITA